jgi:hypothetical protein
MDKHHPAFNRSACIKALGAGEVSSTASWTQCPTAECGYMEMHTQYSQHSKT